jgi:hypothetical protein
MVVVWIIYAALTLVEGVLNTLIAAAIPCARTIFVVSTQVDFVLTFHSVAGPIFALATNVFYHLSV